MTNDERAWIEAAYYEWIADESRYGLSGLLDMLNKHGLVLQAADALRTKPESDVLRKAKVLSQIWTSKGEVTDPDVLFAIGDLHDAICALYGVDPKVGFQMYAKPESEWNEALERVAKIADDNAAFHNFAAVDAGSELERLAVKHRGAVAKEISTAIRSLKRDP